MDQGKKPGGLRPALVGLRPGLVVARTLVRAGLVAALYWTAPFGEVLAADVQRGRLLYETHCIACHDTRVHKRDEKIALNYDNIRMQVLRWQTNTFLRWDVGDIDAVATYLARTFYKVPCPDC